MPDSKSPPAEFPATTALGELLRAGTPWLDVRAEVEFARGAVPGAVNQPILTTQERQQVGTCYKQQGQPAAVALGHTLVGGAVRARRTAAWCDFAQLHPNAWVYCWRGGMRSNLAAKWLAEAGNPLPVVPGGFKALRRVLLDQIAFSARQQPMLRLGGKTGVAKTRLLQQVPHSIDLEAYANHRGSSFGRRAGGPNSQIDFEHLLGVALLRLSADGTPRPLVVEDESRRIGAVSIPANFFAALRAAPLVVLDMPLAYRVETILQDYIVASLAEFSALFGEQAQPRFCQHLRDSLLRLRRRLGGLQYRQLDTIMQQALQAQFASGDLQLHRHWISQLLTQYYDPMYEYQLSRNPEPVLFAGDATAVQQFLLQATTPA